MRACMQAARPTLSARTAPVASTARCGDRPANVVTLFADVNFWRPATSTPDEVERLVRGVRERDSAAFEPLYDRYHQLVYGIARRMRPTRRPPRTSPRRLPQAVDEPGGISRRSLQRLARTGRTQFARSMRCAVAQFAASRSRRPPRQCSKRKPTTSCCPGSTATTCGARWNGCRANIASSLRWGSSRASRTAKSRASRPFRSARQAPHSHRPAPLASRVGTAHPRLILPIASPSRPP
jgi:hypothetical protein